MATLKKDNKIPVYSLDSFVQNASQQNYFRVEPFDANRHFQVAYPHRHDFYEVLFLHTGTGLHIIDSHAYEIKPPCVFFLSPGQAHKLELSKDIEGYIFLFTTEFYALFDFNKNKLLEFPFFFSVEQSNPPLYIQNPTDSMFLKELFIRGCFESNTASHSMEVTHTILQLILLTCNQLYSKNITTHAPPKSQIIVKKFFLALEETYIYNYNIEFYAQQLSITANHLSQIIKQITGKSAGSIIQEKRLVEIKRLLLHTDMNIGQIAEHLHFNDISYMTKFFKKYMNITPLHYREKELKNADNK